jgi:purine-cytosine permease-like protein
MEKQQVLDKTVEVLRPFETSNLMTTLQTLSLAQLFTNPVVLIIIIGVLFFGVLKRSMTILLTLFFLIAMIVFMRYAMPAPGQELSLSSIVPFIGFGVAIGGVIIYFAMIKSD